LQTKLSLCAKILFHHTVFVRGANAAAGMHLDDHDLKQLDEEYLLSLSPVQLQTLSTKLLADLKEAHDRLNQNPSNSSRPPSTRAPWEKSEETSQDGGEDDDGAQDAASDSAVDCKSDGEAEKGKQDKEKPDPKTTDRRDTSQGRPGRREGAPGYSRTQQLPIDEEHVHRPGTCSACGVSLNDACEQHAYTARYEIELVQPGNGGNGLVLVQTKHIYLERQCQCGHWTREQPGRCSEEEGWSVELTEWHLAGPLLVCFICALALRQRLSRARIREFLHDWLGLDLGVATINQCIHEAGRAVEPVVEQEIRSALREVELVYADETSWKEHGQLLWLWVFTCASVTFFIVGQRSREMVQRVLGESFEHWLMSDGYGVYREYTWRLRCLAHIVRKARGLEESLDRDARRFGEHVLNVLETVMDAVYRARGSPPDIPLRETHARMLADFFTACVDNADSKHEKTCALARELLNDWDTFWVVLDHPELPLTNNAAERALRHWVIARRISHGTRTAQGTHAFSLLASVIETCRQRAISPWPYLAEVVRQRRKDLPAPSLPLSAS
jgi:transposase